MSQFFKAGLLVEDIEKACEEIGRWLGLEWTPVQESPLVLETASGREQVSLRFAYSLGDPPHLELLEAQTKGYYAVRRGEHIHHLGLWVDDLAEASAGFERLGLPLEAAGVDPQGTTPAIFAFHRGAHGLRLELVSNANKTNFEKWLAGGELEL